MLWNILIIVCPSFKVFVAVEYTKYAADKSQLRIKSEIYLINVEMIYRSSISFSRQSNPHKKGTSTHRNMYDPVFSNL